MSSTLPSSWGKYFYTMYKTMHIESCIRSLIFFFLRRKRSWPRQSVRRAELRHGSSAAGNGRKH